MLFLLWCVFLHPPREGLFVINLIPFTQGFEWFLFVVKNNSKGVSKGLSKGVSKGSTHGEANDKCIAA